MDSRREKARQLVEAGCVFPDPGLKQVAVVSGSDDRSYLVFFGDGRASCTCPSWGFCRDEWLAPLVAQISEQAEMIGQLRERADRLQAERDELRARLEALSATQAVPEPQDEPSAPVYVYRVPESAQRPWGSSGG
jgi:uncharacterized Zn finger protein